MPAVRRQTKTKKAPLANRVRGASVKSALRVFVPIMCIAFYGHLKLNQVGVLTRCVCTPLHGSNHWCRPACCCQRYATLAKEEAAVNVSRVSLAVCESRSGTDPPRPHA
jgi:hypothetical protein